MKKYGAVTAFNPTSYFGIITVVEGVERYKFHSTSFVSLPTRFPQVGDKVEVFVEGGELVRAWLVP